MPTDADMLWNPVTWIIFLWHAGFTATSLKANQLL